MQGLHLTNDLHDCACPPSLLRDRAALQRSCMQLATDAGLTVVGDHFHTFADAGGVTGLVLLAESHLAIHTWPELNAVTLDVYVCNFVDDNSYKARALMDGLVTLFAPMRKNTHELRRGVPQSPETPLDATPPLALEWLTPDVAHGVRITRPPVMTHSKFQRIEWHDTPAMGRVLALDGAFMLSERDEFIYHECMVHVPALAHPAPQRALVMGGGDGCIARELLKHPGIEEIVIAELDPAMIEECRTRLAAINQHAFDNKRVTIVVGDALAYARQAHDAGEHFDLVVMDLTDPDSDTQSASSADVQDAGNASGLYSVESYRLVRDLLTADGLLSLHIGSPFFHSSRFAYALRDLRKVFAEVHAYKAFMPLYGAEWGMACASMQTNPTAVSVDQIQQRMTSRGIDHLNFYTARSHHSLFAWPAYAEALGA